MTSGLMHNLEGTELSAFYFWVGASIMGDGFSLRRFILLLPMKV